MIPSPFGYPPVFIYFLSFFPKDFLEKYQFLVSPFFDSLQNYLIFLASYFLSGNIFVAIIAQVVASLTLISVVESSNLNTRSISYLFVSISLFALILFVTNNQLIYLIIAAVVLFILFFTHRLSLQAYLVSAVALSVFTGNPIYILFFFFVFLLVYVFGGKRYKLILAEHLGSLNFWIENINVRFAHQFRGNAKKEQKDFVERMYQLSVKNPVVYIIGNNIWLAFLALLLLASYFRFISFSFPFSPSIVLILETWTGALVAWSMLVLWVKQMRFLGEGQRYLEYAIFPVSILVGGATASLFSRYGWVAELLFIIFVLGLFASTVFLQKKTILHDRLRTITKEKREIIDYLNKDGKKDFNMAVFPVHMADSMVYFTKGRVLLADTLPGTKGYLDVYPVITKPMSKIVEKYHLDYILFDRKYVTDQEINLPQAKIIKDTDDFVLLKV
ncbi:MAG: hypothetical protein Q7K55_03800 [Candidatus Levybacteria bacterium]|nr:hypothetical protein [Candidatus Levybacteria bacterium]